MRRHKWIAQEVELLVDDYGFVRAILYPENDSCRLVELPEPASPEPASPVTVTVTDEVGKNQKVARRDAIKRFVEAGYR